MEKNKKAILLFLSLSFGLAWLLMLVAVLLGVRNSSPQWAGMLVVCMFCPAVASLLTRKLTGEGFHNMRIKPRFRGNISSYLVALFVPILCIVCGCLVYFTFFPQYLDVGNQALVQQLVDASAQNGITITEAAARGGFYSQLVVIFLIAPFVNLVPVFGEELGWRGYLLQKLTGLFSPTKAIVLSGVIWGVWHLPMIVMGHNYGFAYPGYPFTGIALMTLFCVATGILMSYLSLRTGSVIAACLVHSTLNAIAGVGLYFMNPSLQISTMELTLIGPVSTGILGMSFFVLIGLLYLLKARRLTWNGETEMAVAEKRRPLLVRKKK